MADKIDCVICGSCTIDILVRPIPLNAIIPAGKLISVEPIGLAPGGIVSNTGIALQRLGIRTAAMTYAGADRWATLIRSELAAGGLDIGLVIDHPTAPSSTTVVLIDPSGERSFAHCVGAPKSIDKQFILNQLDRIAQARLFALGYYSMMPKLDSDLPEVFAAIRETGCLTALDAAGTGGSMQPLDRILPHLDFYVPSLGEAEHQTGLTDPQAIIDTYRRCGAPGLLGVKLGSRGALLSPRAGEWVHVDCVAAPGPVVDTTGAGDCFYAGLLAGILHGMTVAEAGRLAAAAGACCVTGLGATAGLRSFAETCRLAGVPPR